MTERTPQETVAQAVGDFDKIREAIRGHKIDVPYPTKTSEYAELIAKIRVGSISDFSCCLPRGQCISAEIGDCEYLDSVEFIPNLETT